VNKVVKLFLTALLLWLVFVAPPATVFGLLNGIPLLTAWWVSMVFLPFPALLFVSVFRSKSATYRWWVFQYLGFSSVGFTAAAIGAASSLFLANKLAGLIALGLFSVFYLMSLLAAHRLHLVPLNIISEKITKPLRVVHISDVHIGSRRPAYLDKVVSKVNTQQPDMLVITGDLIDENVADGALKSLASLPCPVFYSSGNHERYVDYKRALKNIASHGVTVLGNEATVNQGIHIIGVEDCQQVGQAKEALETLCRANESSVNSFRILLYHQPDLWAAAIEQNIDLMLAGHTHKGQVWPFEWFVRMRYKHVAGHFQSGLSHLFVSQGTGTWGPILRFGTRCEMTVIDLQSE